MNEEKERIVIYRTKVDFDELEKWRDVERDDLPIVSFLAFYRATGIMSAIENYVKDHPDYYLYHLDNILCNVETHKKMKHFIDNMWQVYDISIDADNHPFWNTTKYGKNKKHYVKKLNSTIQKCLAKDFSTYCPGLDDDLQDGEFMLVDYIDKDPNIIDVESVDIIK